MIHTQNHQNQIIPMDLTSMAHLLESSGGDFSPLQYHMVQPSPKVTEIHVNIQSCDPDSIHVDVTNHSIDISATATLTVQTNATLTLTRPVSTRITMAPGVLHSDIRSQITDEALVLTIPMT